MNYKVVTAEILIVLVASFGAYYCNAQNATYETGVQTPAANIDKTRINQEDSDTLPILAQRWSQEFMNKPEFSDAVISFSSVGSGTGYGVEKYIKNR